MTKYYADDGGSNTLPYDTLAKAANLVETIDAIGLVAGDVVRIRSNTLEDRSIDTTYTFADDVLITSIDGSENYETMSAGGGELGTKSSSAADLEILGGSYEGINGVVGDQIQIGGDAADQTLRDCRFECTRESNYITLQGAASKKTFVNCTFVQVSTDASAILSSAGDGQYIDFKNCVFIGNGATLLFRLASLGVTVHFNGCDFSSYGNTATSFQWMESNQNGEMKVTFVNCIPPDRSILRPDMGPGQTLDLIGCDTAHPYVIERQRHLAYLLTNTAVVKTGGMALPDPATPFSYQIVSNSGLAAANNIKIFEAPETWDWNDDATDKNASVKILLQRASGGVIPPTPWDMGVYMIALESASTPKSAVYQNMYPQAGDDPDGTPPSYSESGTDGDGWTGWTGDAKEFDITLPAVQTIGRKGQVKVIFWCRKSCRKRRAVPKPTDDIDSLMTKYYHAPDGSIVQDSEKGYEYHDPGGGILEEFAGGPPPTGWEGNINEIASPASVNEITDIGSVNEL